jgi:hypothetical protein
MAQRKTPLHRHDQPGNHRRDRQHYRGLPGQHREGVDQSGGNRVGMAAAPEPADVQDDRDQGE